MANPKSTSRITDIIRANRERVRIASDTELAIRIGMPVPTIRYRMKNPSTWKQYELRDLCRITNMPDEDIVALIRG